MKMHGQSYTPEYRAFIDIKSRCENSNHRHFHNWGGRGIKNLFPDFESFLATVGKRPSSAHSIHRIDNDGHYQHGNVIWTDWITQGRIKRVWKNQIAARERAHEIVDLYKQGHGPKGIAKEFGVGTSHIRKILVEQLGIDYTKTERSHKKPNCTSHFRGVSFHKKSQKWIAYVCVKRRSIHLGLFDNEIDAAKARKSVVSVLTQNRAIEIKAAA